MQREVRKVRALYMDIRWTPPWSDFNTVRPTPLSSNERCKHKKGGTAVKSLSSLNSLNNKLFRDFLFYDQEEEWDEDYIKRWISQRICTGNVCNRYCKRSERGSGTCSLCRRGKWRGRWPENRSGAGLWVEYPDCKGWERSGSTSSYRKPCDGTGCKTSLSEHQAGNRTGYWWRILLWLWQRRRIYPGWSGKVRGWDEENR